MDEAESERFVAEKDRGWALHRSAGFSGGQEDESFTPLHLAASVYKLASL